MNDTIGENEDIVTKTVLILSLFYIVTYGVVMIIALLQIVTSHKTKITSKSKASGTSDYDWKFVTLIATVLSCIIIVTFYSARILVPNLSKTLFIIVPWQCAVVTSIAFFLGTINFFVQLYCMNNETMKEQTLRSGLHAIALFSVASIIISTLAAMKKLEVLDAFRIHFFFTGTIAIFAGYQLGMHGEKLILALLKAFEGTLQNTGASSPGQNVVQVQVRNRIRKVKLLKISNAVPLVIGGIAMIAMSMTKAFYNLDVLYWYMDILTFGELQAMVPLLIFFWRKKSS